MIQLAGLGSINNRFQVPVFPAVLCYWLGVVGYSADYHDDSVSNIWNMID